jgi:heme-degrading monooxygenase HmoA
MNRRPIVLSEEVQMIAAFVRFESDGLDDERVRKVAAEARATFEGMPGLRNKFFTLGENNSATNVYVWETEEAARQFFSDQLLERVTGLYGVRPLIEFAEVLEMVDNS